MLSFLTTTTIIAVIINIIIILLSPDNHSTQILNILNIKYYYYISDLAQLHHTP